MKCDCFQPDFGGICHGTKEREHCACNGEMENCDFYPDVRAKLWIPSKPASELDAVTFFKVRGRMCNLGCKNCPIEREIGDSLIDCNDWIEKYPEKAVEAVSQWAAMHPELTTWNEWLHYMQGYYGGFSSMPFIEWLNTPIPEDARKRFNIG